MGLIALIVGLIVLIYVFIVLFVDSVVCDKMRYCLNESRACRRVRGTC